MRKLLLVPLVVLLATTVVFFAFAVVPGDPALLYAGEEAPAEYVQRLRREFGLDKPVVERYCDFLRGLGRGQLGSSYFSGKPVGDELVSRVANTVQLALVSMSVATAFGVALGIASALRPDSGWDRVCSLVAVLGISVPPFWLGFLLILVFAIRLPWLPVAGKLGVGSLVLPALTMSAYPLAFIARMTRSCLLEVMREDFIRTARAKGLAERVVVFKHALRNAMIPLTTVVGLQMGYLLGGSIVVESVFAWPGLGLQLVTAIGQRDYPVIRGVILVYAMTFVLVNTTVELLYSIIDPRVGG